MTKMASSDASLLETERDEEREALYQQLLLQASELQGIDPEKVPMYNTIVPEAGFCVKTKNDQGEKIFINICKTDRMPAPKEVSEDDLREILASESSDYRIPMSIGEPHAEIDKGGKGCTAYDIVINSTFFEKIKEDMMFQAFFLTVCMEGLEDKYDMTLDKHYVILKNRKFLGTLPEQNIRTKSKPRIQEIDSNDSQGTESKPKKSLITEVEESQNESKGLEPEFQILREPPEGHPEFLVAEIMLPNVKTAKTLTLDLGEDRILLHAHPNTYHLDIYLPYDINQDDSGAQFNRNTKILTLTLAVQPV
ncbi:PIH1 domain-containing protein 1-like [Ptychodera flava]|uniref:PIH1 domain-containing protein 1-like n=1 Tax=Ptychodera flava TaxID=63121 RepID=UPI00396A9410